MRDWTKRELFEEQQRLERLAHNHGMRKYWHTVKRAKENHDESGTLPAQTIIKTSLQRVADEIVAKCAKSTGQRSGIAAQYIRPLRPEIVALITLRVVMDGISSPRPLTAIANAIGTRVEDEARFTAIGDETLRKILPAIKHKSDYVHRHLAASKYAKIDYADGWQSWNKTADDVMKIRTHVGIFCIDALMTATGLITMVTQQTGTNKTTNTIVATEETLKWIRQQHTELLELFPEHEPMVYPPRPWTDFNHGAYYTDHIPQMPFVRTRWTAHKDILRAPETIKDMKEVYDGVNAIQNTAWRINPVVLATLEHYYTNKIAAAGLPYQDTIEPPRCPLCGGVVENPHPCFEHDKKALEKWKKQKLRYHKTVLKNDSLVELIGRTIATAKKFVYYPAIYFPYNCDFRGRIYAIPENLNPQASDYSKGLLEFAEGKKITTPEALNWLKIAGANHWGNDGLDKKPFATRCAWVDAHEAEIRAIASDPLENTSWAEADEPWQYLAWCLDYSAYLADPENYESRAVVAMDGSCNGLQHYSAMLRDPIGAAAVNLAPADAPADVYQIVADKVIDQLKNIINNPASSPTDKDMATRWLAVGISRKTTKRSVMVVPYSGTQLACRKYIGEYLDEKIESQISRALSENIGSGLSYLDIDSAVRDAFPFDSDDYDSDNPYSTFKAATWLSKYVWSAIGDTLVAAKEAMGAIRQIATVATRAGIPIEWKTPTGFHVFQSYMDLSTSRLKTILQDTTIRLSLNVDSTELSASEQSNGLAPNFIHSMDASALIKTVAQCKNINITAYAMVHDSYGTHAADALILAKLLRQEFIALYTDHDPLLALGTTIRKKTPDAELPELPAKGNFDLEKVSDSLYFFA